MYGTAATRYFAGTYAEARRKFLDAAVDRGASVESFVLEAYRGALGETLATDVAYLGVLDPDRLLIVSSGTHGVEGFCGSGCQIAALHDASLLARLEHANVALLLVHAVNPHGFSYLHRFNEDNVDVNRNHVAFNAPLPANAAYADLDPLLIPATWPPTPADETAIAAHIERHGERAYRAVVSGGQHIVPDGLFYGGKEPSWSNCTMRAILRKYGASPKHIGWIDIHTGLGPYGHGEKIYVGRNAPADLAKARAWWGVDLFTVFDAQSEAADVSGPIVSAAYDECPQASVALMALEFGTLPVEEVLLRLRADVWLRRHPEAPAKLQHFIRQSVRDAFYCDSDEWKSMILGQARVGLLQAAEGLRNAH